MARPDTDAGRDGQTDDRTFTIREGLWFFVPLAIQAMSQSLTYPLVAAVASRGPGGTLNVAGLAQSTSVLVLLGTLSVGMITTGMVHARTREGYRRFCRVNARMGWALSALQLLVAASPLAHLIFGVVIGLAPGIETPARVTLLWTVPLQLLFVMRCPSIVVLYNARRTGQAMAATLARIVLTALLVPLLCRLGWVGSQWAVVALTLPIALESLAFWWLARPLARTLPPADPHEAVAGEGEIFRFNLPLSVGGLFLSMSAFMVGAFIARAGEATRMLPAYYVAMGLISPLSFAANRLQAVVLGFPPPGRNDRAILRFAGMAGLFFGAIPLLALTPGLSELYFRGVQNVQAEDMPLVRAALLGLAVAPFVVAMRAHVEGLAAARRLPAVILAGQAAYLGVLVTACFVCLSLRVPGNLIGVAGIVAGNVAAVAVVRLMLSAAPGAVEWVAPAADATREE